MENHVKGFDSRFWDGRLDDPDGFRFCYIKLGDGIWHGKESSLTRIQYDSAGNKGIKRGFFYFWRYSVSAQEQAAHFARQLGGYDAELPPVLDLEDKYAPKGAACRAAVNAMLTKLDVAMDYMVYTAPWWWDAWVGKVALLTSNPYIKDLWVADPAPDTPMPGLWRDYAIRQYKLDIKHPSFNACIDEDWARESWWQKHVEPLPKWDDMTPGEKDRVMGELAREHGKAR